MSSLLIWDERSGEIMACRIPPFGSAPAPTIQNVFPHRRSLWPHLRSQWIPQSYTTREARLMLRVVNNEPVPKPRLSLSWRAGTEPLETVLSITVSDLLPGEALTGILCVLESAGLEPVEFEVDPGDTPIEFPAPGFYLLRVIDDRVQPVPPIEVVVE